MDLRDFHADNRFGLIVRVSGHNEKVAQRRFLYLQQVLREFNNRSLYGQPLLQQVDVAVWSNPLYADCCDVGTTFQRVQQLRKYHFPVMAHQITRGDLSCVALNEVMECQRQAGITHTFVWSCEAYTYITKTTVQQMLRGAQRGTRAVGVILHEYADIIGRLGWVMNTCALWHLQSLQAVGGFDLRAQLSPETYGAASTAEEVLTQIALVERFARCIALVPAPSGAGYIAPHPERQPYEAEVHEAKVTSKQARFWELCTLAGVAPDYIAQHGLLPMRHD